MQKESKRCLEKLKYLANKMTNSTIFTDNGVNVSNDLTQIWKLEIISNTEYHANSEKKMTSHSSFWEATEFRIH